MNDKVVVEIVDQPPPVERFRYKSEERTSAQGVSNVDRNRKQCPSIRVLNYTGVATVLISCVTTEKPYRQHPNSVVGDDCYNGGVCRIEFETNKSKPTVITFKNIAIQCNKKDDVKKVLEERERLNIDPFKAGFKHKCNKTFEAAVRLCFQVLLRSTEVDTNGRFKYVPVVPVVSNIIRSKIDLTIYDISDTTSPATGKKTIMIFCSRTLKGDIKVRFYREDENHVVWEAWGESIKVHRLAAIAFKTPAYATNDIQEPVIVHLQLVRPSDGKRSEPPVQFEYVPDLSTIDNTIRKKQRRITESEALFQYVEQLEEDKRNRAKMEINIHPNIESNQHSNAGAAAIPPATQSNAIPNFSRHGRPHDYPTVQTNPQQQTYFDSRNVSHSHMQQGVLSGHYAQFCDERSQINFLQPQLQVQPPNIQPLSSFQMQSRVVNLPHGQFQMQPEGSKVLNSARSQFRPQNFHYDFQTTSNLQLQTQDGNFLQPIPDSKQLQQRQPTFHRMSSNDGYAGKDPTTPYYPFPSHYNAEQVHDPTSSNVHQFAAGDNASMARHGQNL